MITVTLVIAAVLLIRSSPAASAPRYVFEMIKPALTAEEVKLLKNQREVSYPTYNEIPQTSFSCKSKKQPGFYADTEARCQVFHRCDIAGNRASFLCTSGTIFNQITLVCDHHYNVDCSKSLEYEDFQNERLYTDKQLFDSPPRDWYFDQSASLKAPPENQQMTTLPSLRTSTSASAELETTSVGSADLSVALRIGDSYGKETTSKRKSGMRKTTRTTKQRVKKATRTTTEAPEFDDSDVIPQDQI